MEISLFPRTITAESPRGQSGDTAPRLIRPSRKEGCLAIGDDCEADDEVTAVALRSHISSRAIERRPGTGSERRRKKETTAACCGDEVQT